MKAKDHQFFPTGKKLLKNNKTSSLFFWLLWPIFVSAQTDHSATTYLSSLRTNHNIQFERIAQGNASIGNSILSLSQDQPGFLWVGTRHGVTRYDGYDFKHYKYHQTKMPGLGKGSANSILLDNNKNLWIGTESGLSLFHPATETFSLYRHAPSKLENPASNMVNTIYEDRSGVLWLGTDNGLSYFDKNTKELVSCFLEINERTNKLGYFYVYGITEDPSGAIWLATTGGVYFRPPHSKEKNDFRRFLEVNLMSFMSIYTDREGIIWLGSWQHGLFRLDPRTSAISNYRFGSNNSEDRTKNVISSIYEDKEGILWFGTHNGLYQLDHSREFFQRYVNAETDRESLSDNYITTIFEDASNVLWIGTGYGGLNKRNSEREFLQFYSNDDYSDIELNLNKVTCVLEDRQGALWVGTYNHGLNYLDDKNGRFQHFQYNSGNPFSLSGNTVTALLEDHSQNLWVGTRQGLNRFDHSKNRFQRYISDKADPASLENNYIYDIYQDRSGTIWVGTWDGGLNRYLPGIDGFKKYLHDPENDNSIAANQVYHIIEDPDEPGILWLGTGGGLVRFDTARETFFTRRNNPKVENSPGYSQILSIAFASDRMMWISTLKGLNRFDRRKNIFTRFTMDDGLNVEEIFDCHPDNAGGIWLLRTGGIDRLTPDTGQLKSFSFHSNHPTMYVNIPRFFTSVSGRLYTGGSSGVWSFNPEAVKDDTIAPAVVISGLSYFDSDNPELLQIVSGISAKNNITLSYRNNILNFRFAALNFNKPEQNQYSYRLEGLHQNWFSLGNTREVTLNNLAPGNYTLLVKAANKDGLWSKTPAALQITIHPPWWRTWWAYLIYMISGIILLLLVRRYELNRRSYKHSLTLEKIEAQKLKEMNSLKSRFFTNISHELRTPLTLILGQIESVLTSATQSEIRGKLQMALRNTTRLKILINQLLDISKLEAKKMQLQAQPMNIATFLKGLFYSFHSLAEQKNIDMQYQSDKISNTLAVYFDPPKLEKVILNILSNAFKFTPEGGKITVSVLVHNDSNFIKDNKSETNGFLEIAISDTGPGIPPDKHQFIFNRFYQLDSSATREQEGSGIGLSLAKELLELHHGKIKLESIVGEGTIFRVLLPLGKNHLSAEEIAANPVKIDTGQNEQFIDDSEPPTPFTTLVQDKNPDKEIVLIVEDNQDVRRFIWEQLSPDYHILEATNGLEGISQAKKHIPDIILTDVMMPKMDGFTFSKKIRENEITSHIPIIMLTARAGEADKLTGLDTGVDAYLTKPFNTRELKLRVKKLIEIRKQLRQRFGKATIVKPAEVSVVSQDQQFLEKVVSYINDHLEDEHLDAKALANAVNISVSQLNRKLKALIDQPGGRLIRSMRLQRAADLLKQNAGSVAEIVYRLGYSNQSHFTLMFQKQFGCTPSEYKKQ